MPKRTVIFRGMKRKAVLLVVAAVAVIGAGILSGYHYQNYKNQQNKITQKALAVEASEDAELKALKAGRAEVVTNYNILRIECEKGRAAYDALTNNQRTKVLIPICGAVLVK